MPTNNVFLFSKSFLYMGSSSLGKGGQLTDCVLGESESDGKAIFAKCKA